MGNMLYFTEVNNRILCTEYSGPNLEQRKKFAVNKFPVEHRVVKIARNKEGKLYVLLSSGQVLIFKNFNVLNNKIFKPLENAIKGAYIRYCFKKVGNNVNFQVRKAINNNKKHSFNSAMSVLLAGFLSLTPISTIKYNAIAQSAEEYINDPIQQVRLVGEEPVITEEPFFVEDTSFIEPLEEINIEPIYEEQTSISYDQFTSEFQIANNNDFYSGKVYDDLVSVMNDSQKTAEMNNIIQEYISQNLSGQMWGNAENQGYNNYTIPEKYKNGEYTLNELFDDASATFDVPKDILVSISQHECGQGYYPLNSYTNVYEQNYGGMMGIIDLYGISSNHLPGGTSEGFDIGTNPAISIFSYASTLRFFYDSFKDINIGNGLDSWDIAIAMVAIGTGHVTDINVGFNYCQEYEDMGWSQLNICAPQFKALREAYLNNQLGVNDLTLTVENGVVTHWSDGEMFYYKNGEKTINKMNNSVQSLPRG